MATKKKAAKAKPVKLKHGALSAKIRAYHATHPDEGWSALARRFGCTPQGAKNAVKARARLGSPKRSREVILHPNATKKVA